jgi:hypothetical protein
VTGGLILVAHLRRTARLRARCAGETLAWRRDFPWPEESKLAGTGRPSCRLTLPHLPLMPGETAAASLEVEAPTVELVLRGVRETAVMNRVGTNAPKIRRLMFYRQPLGQFTPVGGRVDLPLTVPAEAPSTRLCEPPLVYWELLVQGARGRPAVILLPVYVR